MRKILRVCLAKRLTTLCAGLTLGVLISFTSLAQTKPQSTSQTTPQTIPKADADDLFLLSLDELSQISVSIASRVDEKITDAPSSVTVLTRRDIEQLGVRSLTELFNYVPGFQSLMSPHESNRSMILARGLADIYGRSLLVMIDGRRINDEYTGGFTFVDRLLSLYNVNKVEFIRGPGSALYGAGAFSGVVNIITEKRKEMTVTGGSNGGQGVSAATYAQVKDIKASIAFNYFRDNGQRYINLTDKNGFGETTQDPLQVMEGRVNLDYQRSRLIAEYSSSRLSDYYVYRRIANGVNQNNSSRVGIYLEHNFKLPNRWQGNARAGFIRYDRYQRTILAPAYVNDWQQNTREAQADFNYLTEFGHQLSIGAYVSRVDIPVAREVLSGARFVLDKMRTITGVYLQDQFQIMDKLRLTAGLRYDKYSDFGDSLNPRLAVIYRVRPSGIVKLMYGRAYRAPSLGDLYDTEVAAVSTGNLYLKPVIANSLELVYQHTQGHNDVSFTVFHNDYTDFITTRTLPSGDTIFDNAYNSRSHGVELALMRQLFQYWRISLGMTHMIFNSTQAPAGVAFSDQKNIAPKTYGNFQLNYQRKKWNWNINTVVRSGINVLDDQGALAIFNSKLIYHSNARFQWSVNVRNLFDSSYATPQNQVVGQNALGNDIQQLPSRGREFFLTFTYTPVGSSGGSSLSH